MFCSAVTGCHSTSTKLLFIYLKTCIPWKKMPQDSTVFLKLNPAGWSGEQASEHSCAPNTAIGTGFLMSHTPPPLLSSRRAWKNASCVLSCEGGSSLGSQTKCFTQQQGCHFFPYQESGFKSSDSPSCPAALQSPHPAAGQKIPHHVRVTRSPLAEFVRKTALISYLT